MLSKKISLVGEFDQVIGTVTLEHLWADVYGIKIIKTESYVDPKKWIKGIESALKASEEQKATQVMLRLIKDAASEEISNVLPSLGFTKKNERIEFKKNVELLPDNVDSPLSWKSAAELNLTEKEIANLLSLVATGDPGHDPSEDPMDFIQDILSDSVLTSGPQCIHVGFIKDEIAAFTVVQINSKNGWSRISYMGIAPRFRDQGLGKWVHRYSFSRMKIEGGKTYHGGTDASNKAMIRLFELHHCEQIHHMEEWSK